MTAVNEGLLRLAFPGEPEAEEIVDRSLMGEVKSLRYTAEIPGEGSVSVNCSDLPASARLFAGEETVFENARGSFLKEVHGKTEAWEPVKHEENEGMRLHFRTPPKQGERGHPGYDGEAWFFLKGEYLYVIAVMDRMDEDLNLQERVFSSIEFKEE